MVYGFAVQAKRGDQVGDIELEQSIRRNFSGLDDVDPVEIFSREFPRLERKVEVNKCIEVFTSIGKLCEV
jgi:hypothetical protein